MGKLIFFAAAALLALMGIIFLSISSVLGKKYKRKIEHCTHKTTARVITMRRVTSHDSYATPTISWYPVYEYYVGTQKLEKHSNYGQDKQICFLRVCFMWKEKERIMAIFVVALLYIMLYILGIGCPIKFLTGISCAGCGMTRAWMSVIRLDFIQAFHYHPLFWLVPIGACLYLFRKRISHKTVRFLTGILIFIFITVYVIRLMNPEDTVVKIEFYESAIWHILKRVREIL